MELDSDLRAGNARRRRRTARHGTRFDPPATGRLGARAEEGREGEPDSDTTTCRRPDDTRRPRGHHASACSSTSSPAPARTRGGQDRRHARTRCAAAPRAPPEHRRTRRPSRSRSRAAGPAAAGAATPRRDTADARGGTSPRRDAEPRISSSAASASPGARGDRVGERRAPEEERLPGSGARAARAAARCRSRHSRVAPPPTTGRRRRRAAGWGRSAPYDGRPWQRGGTS